MDANTQRQIAISIEAARGVVNVYCPDESLYFDDLARDFQDKRKYFAGDIAFGVMDIVDFLTPHILLLSTQVGKLLISAATDTAKDIVKERIKNWIAQRYDTAAPASPRPTEILHLHNLMVVAEKQLEECGVTHERAHEISVAVVSEVCRQLIEGGENDRRI
jgi:hypothetical protein